MADRDANLGHLKPLPGIALDWEPAPAILQRMETSEFLSPERAHIAELLEQKNILPTVQRIEIACLMLGEAQHLSADQVLARSRAAGLTVSKATVYNTLGLLVEKGLVREVIVDTTKVFYDSTTTPHHHFYNIDDATLTDISPVTLPIDRLPLPPEGTETTGVDIVIRIRNKV